ncbi:MAG: glycoside hydrolase family 15 protein [Kofleriaceae bacterium]
MATWLEDYALLGDLETAALVGRDGTIDWMCLPRFDSDACFAALLGDRGNGRWTLGPTGAVTASHRQYRDHSLVLDTTLETASGAIVLTDCMPVRADAPRLIRLVTCERGEVEIETRLSARFGYGRHRPWTRPEADRIAITSAPDALAVWCERPLSIDAGDTLGRFTLRGGESVAVTLAWHPAHVAAPACGDPRGSIADTLAWWRAWADRCTYRGPWRSHVMRSLATLKALTYAPTGGIVAAPTTSLPEHIGGERNWDYRYCWLRDTSLTLAALLDAGFEREAVAFAGWLERAARGEPQRVQIMYAVTGESRLTEIELPWLSGYEGSQPVRLGNAASEQLQLDVYGELVDCFHQARVRGVVLGPEIWLFERELVEHLETIWESPDRGIWEIRGDEQQFTFSKIMAWVAFDRMIKDADAHSLDGPVDRWKRLRERIHTEICARGYDAKRGAFTQVFGKPALDASLLLIAQLGFLPADDPRVISTVAAIRAELLHDGLVRRYDTRDSVDGLPPGEGVFLACSFWLADAMDLEGDRAGACRYFEHLLELRNDVGLLAEQYDPDRRRLVGNFPQAFSHLALIRTAIRLGSPSEPTPDQEPAVSPPETPSS